MIDAYRSACDDAGKEPGEVILQSGFSWAADDDAALEGCRVWKGAQPIEHFRDDWHDPQAMYENGERQVSDDDFRDAFIISSDPDHHAERVREIERLGPTTVCLQNAPARRRSRRSTSMAKKVLPALRVGRAVTASGGWPLPKIDGR